MESVSQCNFVPCSNSLDLYWLILDRMSGISLFGHKFADVGLERKDQITQAIKTDSNYNENCHPANFRFLLPWLIQGLISRSRKAGVTAVFNCRNRASKDLELPARNLSFALSVKSIMT